VKLLTAPLADAIDELDTHIGLTGSALAQADARLEAAFRTASIKSFEYCYELSIKLLMRALENHPAVAAVDDLTFRGLMRLGAERGFLTDADAWHLYRHQRNKTSHTYNADTAREVFSVLPQFAVSAKALLAKLEAADAS
jgi:nucleotidyltransferase substrate binding protein (TIGR01987 family)